MFYSYDTYGWYAGTVPPGSKRATALEPPDLSVTTTPGEIRANWTGRSWVLRAYATPAAPPPPPPPSPPTEVTMAQARIALSRAGISENAVDATINGMPPGQAKTEAKIWWNYSSTVRRTHPSVVALAPALGLTDSDLDALFTAAAAIDGS